VSAQLIVNLSVARIGVFGVALEQVGDTGFSGVHPVVSVDNSSMGKSFSVNLDNIERSSTSIIKTVFEVGVLNTLLVEEFFLVIHVGGLDRVFEVIASFEGISVNLIPLSGTSTVGAEVALGSATELTVGAGNAFTATSVSTESALVGTSLVGADLALVDTTFFVGADSALEVTSVSADGTHGGTSGDGEGTSITVGAHSALTITSVLAESALSLTGGLIGFSGFENGVVTNESHTFFGNFESTNDGVDDLLGGGGLDTKDLHVAVGTILGEGDEVRLGNGFSAHFGESGVTLVDGGLDDLSIEGGEESVGNVRFLGGLVGDESESENSTAESSGEDSGSDKNLLGTVERASESLDTKLKLSESRATSGFEFHF
jgi:hypothetical protein